MSAPSIVTWLKNACLVVLFAYQVLILVYQFQGALESYYFHLGAVLVLASLVVVSMLLERERGVKLLLKLALPIAVLVATVLSAIYLYLNVGEIELRQPFLEGADVIAGFVIVACTIALTWLVWGAILALVIAAAVFYFYFGEYFPGNFRFKPPETEIIVSYLAGMGGARGVLWGIDEWGLTAGLASLDTLGPGQNIDALLDRRTDVGTLFGLTSADGTITVVTGPHRQLEASNRDWRYVQVPAEMTESSTAPFRVVRYQAGTLPNQPQPVTLFGDLLMLSAHESLPEELAYELVRVFVEHGDQIKQYHGFLKPLTNDTMSFMAKENPDFFHPGSLRAFRDFGIIE